MRFVEPQNVTGHYDLVVVGSGFGSLFFVKKFLERQPKSQILILEWGQFNTHAWQIENRRNAPLESEDVTRNNSGKPWLFTIGLGGGTNCWWAQSPRLHPSDFKLKTNYGIGMDWPMTYDDLVPYYKEAEKTIIVAGPDDIDKEWPKTGKYQQPPHNMSSADKLLKAAMPDKHFTVPNARLRTPLGARAACCASATCNLCPGDSKFTAENSLQGLLGDPRVSICLGAKVERLDAEASKISRVQFTSNGREYTAKGDLFVLGANAINSPFILLKSNIAGHGIGRYLSEKMYVHAEVFLKGLKHFDGGTATTCFNTSLLDGEHRREHGANVIYIENRMVYGLRPEFGRWREVLPVSFYIEDIPQESNGISVGDGDMPVIEPFKFTDYAHKSLKDGMEKLPEILKALPVEDIQFREIYPTLGHIQGTVRMGDSLEDSAIGGDLVHHQLRNLVVVGSSTFPTTGSVNISLTVAALSLRAADRLTRSAA